MKVFIASDHAGYWLKESLKTDLRSMGHDVVDVGNTKYESGDDYPDFIIPCAEKVASTPGSMGIVIGRSGNGEAIAANKVKGVRAALCPNEETAKLTRTDNNANVCALGAEYVDQRQAEKITAAFLDTPFPEEERHVRRVNKITTYEAS